ncbi:unnamed protein product, partial [Bubo scandiacus]
NFPAGALLCDQAEGLSNRLFQDMPEDRGGSCAGKNMSIYREQDLIHNRGSFEL